VPPRAQAADDGRLPGRQRARDDLVDARGGGHGPRGRLVVAGQQHRLQAEGPEPGHRRGRRRLDRVSDREGAPGSAVPAGQDRGATRPLPLATLLAEVVGNGQAVFGQQRRPPDQDFGPADDAASAESRQRQEAVSQR
jgi:hypothetical protein